jgi:hypothetical protein
VIVCSQRKPHPLIWAKLKGFPYWPAKALRVINNEIDVRFFGTHDRARIQASKCFWISTKTPASTVNNHTENLVRSLVELELHISLLTVKFGVFVYAPFKSVVAVDTPFVFSPNSKVSATNHALL